jgi:hypothetical protein
MDLPSVAEDAERAYISTGHLPVHDIAQKHLEAPVSNFKSHTDGQYPVGRGRSPFHLRSQQLSKIEDDT